MKFVVATDENGVTYHALTDEVETNGHYNVWIFTDKPSGFGDDVGRVNLHQLKKLADGSYGA